MPPSKPANDLPVYAFASAAEFEAFMDREHLTLPGFRLKLAKKSSGIPSISSSEAIEVALCFGWIDGQANGVDENWWTVRYTPRRAKSIWSQKNVNTVYQLIEKAKMRPAGLVAVDTAKADGRWDRAYAGPATITVPDDFATALSSEPAASVLFESLNKTDRYAVLWRIETASVQARAKRIEAIVQLLATGVVPGAEAKKAAKTKKVMADEKVTGKTKDKAKSVKKEKVTKRQSVSKNIAERPRRSGLRDRPG